MPSTRKNQQTRRRSSMLVRLIRFAAVLARKADRKTAPAAVPNYLRILGMLISVALLVCGIGLAAWTAVGELLPAQVQILLPLGVGLLALGFGLLLAQGFGEIAKFTYFGVTLGGTLAAAAVVIAGWKLLATPPIFQYAVFQFECGSQALQGNVRLAVQAGLSAPQMKDMTKSLVQLEREYFEKQRPAGTPDTQLAVIKEQDDGTLLIPSVSDEVYLPTIFATDHDVRAERSDAVKTAEASDLQSGSDLEARNSLPKFAPVGDEYKTFMQFRIRPYSVQDGSTTWLSWQPRILKATIFLDQVAKVCDDGRHEQP